MKDLARSVCYDIKHLTDSVAKTVDTKLAFYQTTIPFNIIIVNMAIDIIALDLTMIPVIHTDFKLNYSRFVTHTVRP